MRIGIDIRELEKGKKTGIGRILTGFLDYISLNDTANEYLLFGNQFTEPFTPHLYISAGRVPQKNVKVRIIRERVTFIWDQIKLPLSLKKAKVQIFFSPYFKAPIFAPCNFVTMIHDLIPLKSSGNTLAKFYYVIWGRLCAKFATKIITVSLFSKEELLKILHINNRKVNVVYNSIDEIFFCPVSREVINKMKKNYGIKNEFILWIGVMKLSKNLPHLIEAYVMLPAEVKDKYNLVIGGKKNKYFKELEALVKELGLENKVLFPGFIADKDLPALYREASLFVFPSLYEGFGIPPLEAMACGTPVVASNTTSLPEVLGDAAILVNPLDTQKLAQGIANVLTDGNLREKLIQGGIKRSQNFSTERCAKELLKCLIT